jgi:hypothetical protein
VTLTPTELQQWAFEYVWNGQPVVPTRRNKPIVAWASYQTELPTDDDINLWNWRRADGIALVIGQALYNEIGTYVCVLDIEAPHLDVAERWLDRNLPSWRSGRNVESGSGGLHLHCRASELVKTTKCAWGDIKGDRSLAYLPPTRSAKTGNLYRWLSKGELIDLEPDRIPGVQNHLLGKVPKSQGWAAAEFRTRLGEGEGRRELLPRLVGYLRGHSVDCETAVAILELWDARNTVPLGPDELRKHVEGMYQRYGMPESPKSSRLIYRRAVTP